MGFSRQEHWGGLPFPSPKGTIERKKVKSLSRVQLFATPQTVAPQAPLSMGFSRQEYWRRLPCPPPGDSSQPRDWTRVSYVSHTDRRVPNPQRHLRKLSGNSWVEPLPADGQKAEKMKLTVKALQGSSKIYRKQNARRMTPAHPIGEPAQNGSDHRTF